MHRYNKSRDNVGVILRTFASNPQDVEKRAKMTVEAINSLEGLASRIDVLIHADKRFAEKDRDCGQLADAILKHGGIRNGAGLAVQEVHHGDLFCGLLNFGIAQQSRFGCEYSLILSPDAASYATRETMDEVLAAASQGALAVGVAIGELSQSIREGRLANTFCLWHNQSLQTVGGFDLKAAKPVDDRLAHYMRGSSDGREVYYQLAGVEEVIPLARMVEHFGPCIAVVEPKGGGAAYEVPDPVTQPELYKRHLSKFGTKFERQATLLGGAGFDFSWLKGGLMKP